MITLIFLQYSMPRPPFRVNSVATNNVRCPVIRRCRHGGWQQIQMASASALAARRRLPSSCYHHHQQQQQQHLLPKNPLSSPHRRYFHSSFTPLHRQHHHPKLSTLFCPYQTLQIPKDSSYAHAKKSFLKIAMKHHPDTMTKQIEEAAKIKSQEIFMSCRKALEMLVECEETGRAILKSNSNLEGDSDISGSGTSRSRRHSSMMSNEEFDSWFEKETGHSSNPFQFDLDPQVMREVADMHSNMEGSHGLDRDGGMWHLASMISNAVKSGKESGGGAAESILRLEAGSSVNDGGGEDAMGKLERRRRRNTMTRKKY